MIPTLLNRIIRNDKKFLERIFKNLGLKISEGGYLGRKETWWNIHCGKKFLGSIEFNKKGKVEK
jgi:hypothetical protein